MIIDIRVNLQHENYHAGGCFEVRIVAVLSLDSREDGVVVEVVVANGCGQLSPESAGGRCRWSFHPSIRRDSFIASQTPF